MPPARLSASNTKAARAVAATAVSAPRPRAARGRKRANQHDEDDPASSAADAEEAAASEVTTKPNRPVVKRSKKATVAVAVPSEPSSMMDDPASESNASSAAAGASKSSSASVGCGPPPRSRLDSDCLSVVFSLLSTADFLCAIRVSREWRSARSRRLAWPALSVRPLIRALQDDDYSNPVRRRLAINSPQQLRSLLAHAQSMMGWRHVTDVRVAQRTAGATRREAVDNGRLIEQLLAFTAMQALTLDGTTASAAEIELLYAALADRLQALMLFRCSDDFSARLGSLTQLRILVLDRIPITKQIAPLTHLVYLHMESHKLRELDLNGALGETVRGLSTRCALRSLSLTGFTEEQYWDEENHIAQFFKSLLRSTPRTDPPVTAVDWTVPHGLTDVSLSSDGGEYANEDLTAGFTKLITDSPRLRRLQYEDESWRPTAAMAATMANLHELRLRLPGTRSTLFDDQVRHLEQCVQLRVVQLSIVDWRETWQRKTPLPEIGCAMMQRLLRAWPAIEELRISVDLKLALSSAVIPAATVAAAATTAAAAAPTPANVYDASWASLAACNHLRVLELPLQPEILEAQLPALCSLPSFRSLELSFRGTVSAALPSALLSSMAASSSWFNLHLHALAPQPKHVDFIRSDETSGLAQQLTALTQADPKALSRLRVHSHSERKKPAVECWRIAVNEAAGARAWTAE